MKGLGFLPSEIFKKKYLQPAIIIFPRGHNFSVEGWVNYYFKEKGWRK